MPSKLIAALILTLSLSFAQTETSVKSDTWLVATPYAENPLKRTSLAGTASAGDQTTSAELQVECRGDAGAARLHFLFPSDKLTFDVDPFEGPDGIGGTHALISLSIADRPAKAHNFSGYFIEHNIFVFEFAVSQSELNSMTAPAAADKPLAVVVTPAAGKGAPLRFAFNLPKDSKPLATVTAPCQPPRP